MRFLVALTMFCGLGAAAGAQGADPAPMPNPWTGGSLSVITENDKWAFRGEDRHYTNGLRLSWVSDIVDSSAPSFGGFALGLARWLPTFDPSGEFRYGFSLGQSMYTPGDVRRGERIPDDRPYAGWLYGGFALIQESRRAPAGPDTLDTLEINLGIVGPGAGGRVVQNRWHNLLDVEEARGWSHQLPNEPGLAIYFERKWRDGVNQRIPMMGDLALDVIPHLAASLGNVATYAAAGGTLRFGRNLDGDFGPPRIRPALAGSGYVRGRDELGWYLFAGAEARAVAYDIFLDGPMFRDGGSGVDRRPFIVDIQTGAAITWRSLRFAYTYVVRTREFEAQRSPDRFGALSVTFGF
jgi:lipid A 3-O-deacylase